MSKYARRFKRCATAEPRANQALELKWKARTKMARVVIVGCGKRGIELAGLLRADGHAVRGTTRTRTRVDELEAAGIEPWVGDPDRIATINYSLENATILIWALASAEGEAEAVEPLHGTRLQMLLERTIDTTVRGVLYESVGTLPDDVLAAGAAEVKKACDKNEIPWALIDADPSDAPSWALSAKAAVDELLTRDRG
ncbi:MAG: hypothetical protein F2799_04410 [Actinobacteria bacterium]|uniref:Unannotated protein n=1 Tax=freshwater metagenome TaxID=449393 RepID=A0A6J7DRY1_9ZZZZ|nr:hypothetical protein [Actinomycetota bacterium]